MNFFGVGNFFQANPPFFFWLDGYGLRFFPSWLKIPSTFDTKLLLLYFMIPLMFFCWARFAPCKTFSSPGATIRILQATLRWTPKKVMFLAMALDQNKISNHKMGVSKNRGKTRQNGWFIMVPNPMNKWMIWGETPLFLETPQWHTNHTKKNPAHFFVWCVNLFCFSWGKQDMFQAVTPQNKITGGTRNTDPSLTTSNVGNPRLGSLSFNEQFPYIENMFA